MMKNVRLMIGYTLFALKKFLQREVNATNNDKPLPPIRYAGDPTKVYLA